MKWTLCLALLGACQDGKQQSKATSPARTGDDATTTVVSLPKAALTDAYKADITTLCDVVKLSGAEAKPRDEWWTHVAMFLGPAIKTPEGHEFLIAIQPLRGEAKALALDTEARRVGLASCALATEWRTPR